MVTHSVKAASHAGRVLFIKDGEVFHQNIPGVIILMNSFIEKNCGYTDHVGNRWWKQDAKKDFIQSWPGQAYGRTKKLYTPYILTCIGMVMMFYIVSFLSISDILNSMPGGDTMQMMLGFGCGVIGVFALNFLFYTNSFLVRRSKKGIRALQYSRNGKMESRQGSVMGKLDYRGDFSGHWITFLVLCSLNLQSLP